MNKLVLQASVVHLEPIRYTPAGIPLLSLTLQHASEQTEANMKRKVMCEINAVLLGDLSKLPLHLNAHVLATGFLAKRSAKSTQLVMHINELKIL